MSESSNISTDRSNSVATASEEMTQTITEIAKNVVGIAENAKQALKDVNREDLKADGIVIRSEGDTLYLAGGNLSFFYHPASW